METSNESNGPTLFDPTLFVAATHANPSASPAPGKAKKTRATSGRGYETPLAFLDPVTRSWKMYEATSLLGELPSLEKLPPSGIARSGVLFLRPPWEPTTDATESSLLHTPTGKMNQMSPSMADGKRQSGWWPTPTTQEVEHPNAILNHNGRRVSKDGTNSHSLGLADAVQFWRTPTVDDSKNVNPKPNRYDSLVAQVNEAEKSSPATSETGAAGNGGKLNPEWVEWLMGFPTGWTDLKDSETPSSPK